MLKIIFFGAYIRYTFIIEIKQVRARAGETPAVRMRPII